MTLELEDIDILPHEACPYKPSMGDRVSEYTS